LGRNFIAWMIRGDSLAGTIDSSSAPSQVGPDHQEPGFTVVLQFDVTERIAPGVEDVFIRDTTLTGAVPDLHM
jgi:hypothetical protein